MKRKIKFAVLALTASVILVTTGCKKSKEVELEMVEIPELNIKMLKTEVTQGLYKSVMGDNPSVYKGKNNPVECVSWYDAIYFCNKLSINKGLTPVYSVNGKTNPKKWGYTPHKEKKLDGDVTKNDTANGFRLDLSQ